MQKTLSISPVIPIVTIKNVKDAVPLAQALIKGGIYIIEVTLRTPGALEAIKKIKHEVPNMKVGAGTVITHKQFAEIPTEDIDFIVSPGLTPSLIEYARSCMIPYLPGVSTVSEMMFVQENGYRSMKFFPAELSGGVNLLKAISSILPQARFCPTGGITENNAKDYLALDNVMAVGGSWLAPSDLIEANNWDEITARVKSALDKVR